MFANSQDLPSRLPTQSSTLYSNNITKFLLSIGKDGKFHVNLDDEVVRGALVTMDRQLLWPAPRPAAPPAPAAPPKAVSAAPGRCDIADIRLPPRWRSLPRRSRPGRSLSARSPAPLLLLPASLASASSPRPLSWACSAPSVSLVSSVSALSGTSLLLFTRLSCVRIKLFRILWSKLTCSGHQRPFRSRRCRRSLRYGRRPNAPDLPPVARGCQCPAR